MSLPHAPSNQRVFHPCDAQLPPPPPGVRHVRFKRIGIIVADDPLRSRVESFFRVPMIVLALVTLPLLIIDYFFIQEASHDPTFEPTHDWLWWLTISGLTIIWLAFVVEFAVKIAIAECRIEYVRRNWIDLVIIVVPLLRPLRAASVARTTRVFRLRGVGFKFCRYVFTMVVGMETTDRLLQRWGLKSKAVRREPDKMTRLELMDEVSRLRLRADEWDAWYVAEQEFLKSNGKAPYSQPMHSTESEAHRET